MVVQVEDPALGSVRRQVTRVDRLTDQAERSNHPDTSRPPDRVGAPVVDNRRRTRALGHR